MFSLLQANQYLSICGRLVSTERNVLTDYLLSLGLYLQAVWEQLVVEGLLTSIISISTWLIRKAGPRPTSRSNDVCDPCSFP